MSAGEFSGVDLDLLADYLGGALDGTPQQAEVARLVDQDPDWARAHARLAPAVDEVRDELVDWGVPAVEMPPAVSDRILAALRDADLPTAALSLGVPEEDTDDAVTTDVDDHASTKPSPVPAQPVGGTRRPGGSPRPGQERGAPSHPGRRRRRWARLAGPVALAAAAVVGLGALQLSRPDQAGDSTAGTALSDRGTSPAAPQAYSEDPAGQAPEAASPDRGAASAPTPFRIGSPPVRSGADYTPESLTGPTVMNGPGDGTEPTYGTESDNRLAVPGELSRLGDQAALSACLADIGVEHGVQPLVFDVVDYARFGGLPALVVRFTDAAGVQWAWVSGPECGIPGSGSDTRYRSRVG
ncbi:MULTISPECIES: hypothetical protein [unclassified Micromonospora]|uniref:hypothetical protein n=1 Tax=unclassified Micromonospora TaxID=2617518 RepID=UPI00103392C5|nr:MULTISPECIES: hypothetical protein [unclassified Micromonospora]QKW16909.1 hypothetical protein HUT12_32035 [Verrucosispora sp. NA02020]TBL40878.1 hypothetical protein EYA84_06560 [Verrucosispora sp. SN26_14.1]